MKKGIHPEYYEVKVHCSCGNEWVTRSTKKSLRVEICSACHPLFTGKQKFIDTAGRVERFQRKFKLSDYFEDKKAQKEKAKEEEISLPKLGAVEYREAEPVILPATVETATEKPVEAPQEIKETQRAEAYQAPSVEVNEEIPEAVKTAEVKEEIVKVEEEAKEEIAKSEEVAKEAKEEILEVAEEIKEEIVKIEKVEEEILEKPQAIKATAGKAKAKKPAPKKTTKKPATKKPATKKPVAKKSPVKKTAKKPAAKAKPKPKKPARAKSGKT